VTCDTRFISVSIINFSFTFTLVDFMVADWLSFRWWTHTKLHKKKAPKKPREQETKANDQGPKSRQANSQKEVCHKEVREPLSIQTWCTGTENMEEPRGLPLSSAMNKQFCSFFWINFHPFFSFFINEQMRPWTFIVRILPQFKIPGNYSASQGTSKYKGKN